MEETHESLPTKYLFPEARQTDLGNPDLPFSSVRNTGPIQCASDDLVTETYPYQNGTRHVSPTKVRNGEDVPMSLTWGLVLANVVVYAMSCLTHSESSYADATSAPKDDVGL
jgi:hypothetical protein